MRARENVRKNYKSRDEWARWGERGNGGGLVKNIDMGGRNKMVGKGGLWGRIWKRGIGKSSIFREQWAFKRQLQPLTLMHLKVYFF